MSTPSLVAKNSIVLFGAHVLSRLFLVLSSILLANYFGVELFGTYSFAIAFTALFAPLCDLGADAYLIRELAREDPANEINITALLILKLALALITFSIVVGALQLLGYTESIDTIVYLAALIMIARVYLNTPFVIFRAFQRINYESTIMVLERSVEFLFVLLAILFNLSILEILLLILISIGLSTGVAFLILRRKFLLGSLRWRRPEIPALLRGGLPFALTGVFVTIYFQIDSVMLSKMAGDHSVGLYRSAYNVVFGFFAFSIAVATSLYPFIARWYQTDRAAALIVAQRAIRYSLMVGIPIAFAGSMFSANIMQVLYSHEYLPGALTLSIIIWVLPLMFVTNILGHVLGAIRLQHTVMVIAVVNAIVNIGLNVLLIPRFAQNGAALATVATEGLALVFLSKAVSRQLGPFLEPVWIGRILIASAFMVPFVLLRETVDILIILPLVILAYAGGTLLLKNFSTAEARDLLTLLIPLQKK